MTIKQKIIQRLKSSGYKLSVIDNKIIGKKDNERYKNEVQKITLIFNKDSLTVINSKTKTYKYSEINPNFLNWFLFYN